MSKNLIQIIREDPAVLVPGHATYRWHTTERHKFSRNTEPSGYAMYGLQDTLHLSAYAGGAFAVYKAAAAVAQDPLLASVIEFLK